MRGNIYQQEGETAYAAGVPFWRNPYPIGPKAFAWRVGWSIRWAEDSDRATAVEALEKKGR